MHRLVVVLLFVSSIARADDELPVQVVSEAGDWVAYEGSRLVDGKLIPDRVIATEVEHQLSGTWPVFLHGEKDKETGWAGRSSAFRDDARLLGNTIFEATNVKIAKATCKLDGTFDCTKVTYTGVHPADIKKRVAVTLTMTSRVRATGIVEIEARDGGTVVVALKAVGYGRRDKPEWGQPPSKVLLALDKAGFGGVVHVSRGERLGEITTTGELDLPVVRRPLKRAMGMLTYCYEKVQKTNKTIGGEIATTFEIAANGKVSTIKATGFDATVDRCVEDVVRKIEFEKATKPTKVAFALQFAPTQDMLPKETK